MSHLLANPVQKQYLFDLPRHAHPLTPPDTDNEFLGMGHAGGADPEALPPHDNTIPLYRRAPSVSYINSGPPRERVAQRSMIKWLVVVVPPISLTREHGHLGHTLSTGPINRLSQGILMPLFPTMNSQLGAIAREFNMPSTAGLCLYLHTNHNGIALYPRISDESWHLLWAHLFEGRSSAANTPQLPIGGQIEFDIDLAKARWYDAWIASPRREFVDVPHSVSHSRRQSLTHWRGDSRTTFLEDQGEDQLDSISIAPRNNALNAPRLAPRKLSLLDRFETVSVASGSRAPRHVSPQSPTEEAQTGMLTPIMQEEEPKTAKQAVDALVHSWRRTSASVTTNPLMATGQTSLDPANMPNTIEQLPSASVADDGSELHLSDYAWSVSSMGPPEYEEEDHYDAYSSWHLPSPDIARRAMSEVPLTPMTATSWGAPLSYPPSPIEGYYSPYAPSVDLAGRALSSRPVTPSTATSWGPASYLVSPMLYTDEQLVLSPGLGDRMLLSIPPTPATATSWGAPSPAPWSVLHNDASRAASPDVGARGMLSVPLTPATATSWGAPSPLPSPAYSESRAASPDLGTRGMESTPASPLPGRQWAHVWPYQSTAGSETKKPESAAATVHVWGHVWPYQKVQSNKEVVTKVWRHVWPYQVQAAPRDTVSTSSSNYPYFNLYPAVYPFFDLYPSALRMESRSEEKVVLQARYPAFSLYLAVYPHFDLYPTTVQIARPVSTTSVLINVSLNLEAQYPTFSLYPAVYPWNVYEIYPAVATDEAVSKEVTVKLPAQYPTFDIYPAVYPHSLANIYPSKSVEVARPERTEQKWEVIINLPGVYPHLSIYPAVYPHNLVSIYPAIHELPAAEIVVRQQAQYPQFDLYPAVYPYNLDNIYPPNATSLKVQEPAVTFPSLSPVAIKLTPGYPVFDIYPAVYPWNLLEVYLTTKDELFVLSSVMSLPAVYPNLMIYSAVYPWNLEEIYSASGPSRVSSAKIRVADVVVVNDVKYPYFNLYPAVYPYSLHDIYPPIKSVELDTVVTVQPPRLPVLYPHFDIYPTVYPYSLEEIYPPRLQEVKSAQVADPSHQFYAPSIYTCPYPNVDPFLLVYPELADGYSSSEYVPKTQRVLFRAVNYPAFDIYPAVYPALQIYPPVWKIEEESGPRVVVNYPAFSIYLAVYPHFEIYPAVWRVEEQEVARQFTVVNYPVFAIYPAVYPSFDIYPTVWKVDRPSPLITSTSTSRPVYGPRRKPRFTHRELHEQVFGKTPPTSELMFAPRKKPRFTHQDLHDQVFAAKLTSEAPATPAPSVSALSHPVTQPLPTPSPAPSSAPALARSRSRSGTVSTRPPPPPKPAEFSKPSGLPVPSQSSGGASAPATGPSRRFSVAPSGRPMSMVGLPTHPAANRRMSTIPRPVPPSLTRLPTVEEPEETAGSPQRTHAYTPSGSMSSLERERVGSRSAPVRVGAAADDMQVTPTKAQQTSSSATLSPTLPALDFSPELSRSKTMPSSRTGRSSSILEKMKMYDQANGSPSAKPDEGPMRITMAALSQFPTPPRPPIPSLPASARPVSKLDRSKYPFA